MWIGREKGKDTKDINIREDHYVQNMESPARVRMQPRAGKSRERGIVADMESLRGEGCVWRGETI